MFCPTVIVQPPVQEVQTVSKFILTCTLPNNEHSMSPCLHFKVSTMQEPRVCPALVERTEGNPNFFHLSFLHGLDENGIGWQTDTSRQKSLTGHQHLHQSNYDFFFIVMESQKLGKRKSVNDVSQEPKSFQEPISHCIPDTQKQTENIFVCLS